MSGFPEPMPDPTVLFSEMPGGMTVPPVAVPLLIIDVDGTVREGFDDPLGRFVHGPQDVVVFPRARELMRRWKTAGGRIIGVSNQGGVATGELTLHACQEAMLETQRQASGLFDLILMCLHHPDAPTLELQRCYCRKPRPGLPIEGMVILKSKYRHERYPQSMALVVGDRDEDRGMAEALDIDFLDAAEWRAGA